MSKAVLSNVITILAFVPFFVCCLLQFPVLGAVREVLRRKHPAVLRDLPGRWMGFGSDHQALDWFVIMRRDEPFADPELTAVSRRARWLFLLTLLSWGLLLLVLEVRGRLG